MKPLSFHPLAAAALFSVTLGACATVPLQSEAIAPIPVPGSVAEYTLKGPNASLASAARYVTLDIGPDMARSCGLARTHFEFDSSEPLPQDRLELKGIAECLNRPELAQQPVELVGRADAKGRAEYNLDLGRKRAGRVREILMEQGVTAARITVTSRGAADVSATGDGVYEEGFDRRVDINILGTTHAPR
jgi:peptidoglycan-associated lipoprotein